MAMKWVPFDPDHRCRHELAADTMRRAWWNVAEACGVPHFRIARKAGWTLHHMEVVYKR